jgi:ribosomal protein L20A (L18A)
MMGHHKQPFSKEFATPTPEAARERCFSIFGSKHAVPRRLIKIDKVTEVALSDVQDAVVKHQAEHA